MTKRFWITAWSADGKIEVRLRGPIKLERILDDRSLFEKVMREKDK